MRRSLVRCWGGVLVLLLVAAAPAAAQVQPYGTSDFGGFRNVLPPGTNGFDNLQQALLFEAAKQYPAHSNDQLPMYSKLTTAAPNISPAQLGQFYKDATFGVRNNSVQSTESPEPGVTIVRDKGFGVPHIYGATRAALMFGVGYASAEDRLFLMDALRHAGQGTLASFAGGSNVPMDEGVWADEPYTQQDLANQVAWARAHLPNGAQIFDDAQNYINGINAYITKAESNPLAMAMLLPAEYAAVGQPQGPTPFTLEDVVSVATLVGGIFGNGGGDQLQNALLYQSLKQRFGRERFNIAGSPELVAAPRRPPARRPTPAPSSTPPFTGAADVGPRAAHAAAAAGAPTARVDHSGFATFRSLVDPADPEAPTTVRGKSFPYQQLPFPTKAVLKTIALPDPGSVKLAQTVAAGSAPLSVPLIRSRAAKPASRAGTPASRAATPAGRAATPASGVGTGPLGNLGPGLFAFPRDMSNALLVNAAHSPTGHPLAVMGPQVSYYSPQILMEQDEHGPGIDADGASFPGTNLYVELGHGSDYAWSATSAGQNIIDTFAVPLCNPSGGSVSTGSDYYQLAGRCVQMETLTRTESWKPTLADSTPAGSVTFQTRRTAFGIVIARARVHGRPVAYCNLRSTYMHELDSAVGFGLLNNPAAIKNPRDFAKAAYRIQYTFNWFYTDDKHIAYFNSGLNPVRAPHTNPLFPTWASYPWAGYHGAAATTPSSAVERQTPQSAHPQTVDQGYLTSWNNKQAPGYNDAATGQQYASVFRSQLLDNNINGYLSRGHGKLTLTNLVNAMGNAGTQDLRGVKVLPYALQIIGHPAGGALAHAVAELRGWMASGAHRINRVHPGASGDYQQSDAVRIMDAWWPLLVKAEFQPALGSSLLNQFTGEFPINDQPGHGASGPHLGSAWDVGFYGIVQKDLRAVLHARVAGPLNREYCGGGSLSRCRSVLDRSLQAAVGQSPQHVYPADGVCNAGDQMCSDSIQFKAVGVITQPLIEWVNRPTFQQVVSIPRHG